MRANAALVFAGLGDARGFDVLVSILSDRSDRPDAQGLFHMSELRAERGPPPSPQRHLEEQIASDRYYAAVLLGELKDPEQFPH